MFSFNNTTNSVCIEKKNTLVAHYFNNGICINVAKEPSLFRMTNTLSAVYLAIHHDSLTEVPLTSNAADLEWMKSLTCSSGRESPQLSLISSDLSHSDRWRGNLDLTARCSPPLLYFCTQCFGVFLYLLSFIIPTPGSFGFLSHEVKEKSPLSLSISLS